MRRGGALIAVILAVASLVFGVGRVAAWSPERGVYTRETPAEVAVFNSAIDNPEIGDEREFVKVAEVREDGTRGEYQDELVVSGGKIYEVVVFYHNDAEPKYNSREFDYQGVAQGVRLSAEFPEVIEAEEQGEVRAKIVSENTEVSEVTDGAMLYAEEGVRLSAELGSAKIYNEWGVSGSVLAGSLFGEGVMLGMDELNGVVMGGEEYAGRVVFRLRAESLAEEVPVAGFSVDKKVTGDLKAWADEIVARPGDELEFKISYRNVGSVAQADVSVFDTLEGMSGLKYVRGSTRVLRGEGEERIDDAKGLFSEEGVRLGEVEAGEEVVVFYRVKVLEMEGCGKTVFYNLASASGRRADEENAGTATMYDKVKIEIEPEGCGASESRVAEMILAGVIGLGALGGVGFWFGSRREARRLEREAEGKTKKGRKLEKEREM